MQLGRATLDNNNTYVCAVCAKDNNSSAYAHLIDERGIVRACDICNFAKPVRALSKIIGDNQMQKIDKFINMIMTMLQDKDAIYECDIKVMYKDNTSAALKFDVETS